eukprot:5843431-Alexandrium_andersonii.AAC.1
MNGPHGDTVSDLLRNHRCWTAQFGKLAECGCSARPEQQTNDHISERALGTNASPQPKHEH